MSRHALVLAAAALIGACTTLGPEPSRPAVALPATFPGAAAAEAPVLPADAWTAFGEPELTRLVERTLAANADLAQAAARVEQAQAQWREAAGAREPTLAASGSAQRAQIGAAAPSNTARRSLTFNDFRVGLAASWEIDLWGRLARGEQAARSQLAASEAARDALRLSLAAQAAQGWFALRSLDEQIAATRLVLKTREDAQRLVNLRLQAGTVSRLDAEQAAVLRADAVLLLRDLERQRALAQSALGLLAAEPGLALAEGTLRRTVMPEPPPPGLPSALLERRPDVRRAEQVLAAATAQVGVAQAARLPAISLTGGLGQESAELSDLLKAPARFWSLGVGLALPLLDGHRNAARVEQAEARQREAEAAYQATALQAFREASDALATLAAARGSAADAEARADAAERALKLAQARFDAGYAGYLEYLDAQRSATAARLDALRNRQAQLAATVELWRALGGGWAAAR